MDVVNNSWPVPVHLLVMRVDVRRFTFLIGSSLLWLISWLQSAAGSGMVSVSGETAIAAYVDGRYRVAIFERQGGAWKLGQELGLSGATSSTYFGYSVAVDGDTAVIGAPGDRGRVFVYRRDGGQWHFEQGIAVAPDAGEFERYWFGAAVAIQGDTLIVGCVERDTPDCENPHVFVYVRGGGEWQLQQKLGFPGHTRHHRFGYSLAIDGDRVVVGARFHGIKPVPDRQVGSVSVFRRDGGRWNLEQLLSEPGTFRFGQSVAISGDRIVVGSLGGGHEAFVYQHGEDGWVRKRTIHPPTARDRDSDFGYSLDFDGTTVAIAAPRGGHASVLRLAETPSGSGSVIGQDGEEESWGKFVSVDGDTLMMLRPHEAELRMAHWDGGSWRDAGVLDLPVRERARGAAGGSTGGGGGRSLDQAEE